MGLPVPRIRRGQAHELVCPASDWRMQAVVCSGLSATSTNCTGSLAVQAIHEHCLGHARCKLAAEVLAADHATYLRVICVPRLLDVALEGAAGDARTSAAKSGGSGEQPSGSSKEPGEKGSDAGALTRAGRSRPSIADAATAPAQAQPSAPSQRRP